MTIFIDYNNAWIYKLIHVMFRQGMEESQEGEIFQSNL